MVTAEDEAARRARMQERREELRQSQAGFERVEADAWMEPTMPPMSESDTMGMSGAEGSAQNKHWALTLYKIVDGAGCVHFVQEDWTREFIEDWCADFRAWAEEADNPVTAMSVQLEVGARTGRHHLQCAVTFTKPIKRGGGVRTQGKGLKGLLRMNDAHCEPKLKDSSVQNMHDYCLGENGSEKSKWKTKEGVIIPGRMFGSLECAQGKRNDLLAMRDAIAGGAEVRELALGEDAGLAVATLRHLRAAEYVSSLVRPRRNGGVTPEVYILVGPSNSGKSFWAMTNFPEACRLNLQNGGSSTWYDEYQGEECIIFDDFRGNIPIMTMCAIVDRYPYDLAQRNRRVGQPCLATKFVFTSNRQPSEWYPNVQQADRNALWSRITPRSWDESQSRGWGKIVVQPEGGGDRILSDDASLLEWLPTGDFV